MNLPSVLETLQDIWSLQRHRKLPVYLFLAIAFNLILAPLVLAATGNSFSRTQAWAVGLLLITTCALGIYLFFVMFIPEKF